MGGFGCYRKTIAFLKSPLINEARRTILTVSPSISRPPTDVKFVIVVKCNFSPK